uniref:G-protein coupled receptors family 1 profile domain-containing protein n=1 Tax=Panagrolaimus sp. JU765 TaxID=591449 RepID=A0AC34RAK0_9BILA
MVEKHKFPQSTTTMSPNTSDVGKPIKAFFDLFSADVVTPFPYNPEDYRAPGAAIGLGVIVMAAFIANLLLFGYIIWQKLYKNFISSHFIAHLCVTNALALAVLLPMIIYSLWTGDSPWILNDGMCRLQV